MRSIVSLLAAALVIFLAGEARADAGPQADSPRTVAADEVWQSVSAEAEAEAAQRAGIVRVLEHPAAQEVARRHGLDLERARENVRLLQGAELERLSASASLAQSQLDANGAIVINEMTLIIILLVVIILLLL